MKLPFFNESLNAFLAGLRPREAFLRPQRSWGVTQSAVTKAVRGWKRSLRWSSLIAAVDRSC